MKIAPVSLFLSLALAFSLFKR